MSIFPFRTWSAWTVIAGPLFNTCKARSRCATQRVPFSFTALRRCFICSWRPTSSKPCQQRGEKEYIFYTCSSTASRSVTSLCDLHASFTASSSLWAHPCIPRIWVALSRSFTITPACTPKLTAAPSAVKQTTFDVQSGQNLSLTKVSLTASAMLSAFARFNA